MRENMIRTAGPRVNAHSTGIKVQVEQHVKDKMGGWCNAANGEVSGLFLVRLSDSVFYIYDVFLPEQMGSTGYTKIDGHASGRLYGYLQKKYGMEGMGHLKGWWHTHYTFGTFWSGTDDNTAQSNAVLAEDWSLSIVINQAGSWLARVDIVSPIPVMVDELPIEFVPDKVKHSKRNYKRDIERWVKPFPPEPRKQYATWSGKSTVVVRDEPEEVKFINYGGHLISMEDFNRVVECFCGDMSCIDCSDILKGVANV
jgi:hypothetical protein